MHVAFGRGAADLDQAVVVGISFAFALPQLFDHGGVSNPLNSWDHQYRTKKPGELNAHRAPSGGCCGDGVDGKAPPRP